MANKHETLTSLFTAIANAIRGKTETSESIVADDFPSAIDGIETGVNYTIEYEDLSGTSSGNYTMFTLSRTGTLFEDIFPVCTGVAYNASVNSGFSFAMGVQKYKLEGNVLSIPLNSMAFETTATNFGVINCRVYYIVKT